MTGGAGTQHLFVGGLREAAFSSAVSVFGALDHPDMLVVIGGDARRLAHDPLVRQRLRPGGVDFEARRLGCGNRPAQRGRGHEHGQRGNSAHPTLPKFVLDNASCPSAQVNVAVTAN